MALPNPAHLHLLLNHLPILGTAFVALFLLIGLVRRSRDVITTALALTVVLAAAAWPIQNTGEGAEHQVEDAPWFKKAALEEHEESAERATIALTIAAVLAAGAMVRRRKVSDDTMVAGAAFVVLLVALGLYGVTGSTGGLIRHAEEINAAAPATGSGERSEKD